MFYCFFFAFIIIACINNESPVEETCNNNYKELEGTYMFFTETDTSSQTISFYKSDEGFTTNGIAGYGFWFPSAPMSGILSNDCEIILNQYKDVKQKGLSSPGGYDRYYYESLKGQGEFFPESDSISLYIEYTRTGDFPLEFKGHIYFKKI